MFRLSFFITVFCLILLANSQIQKKKSINKVIWIYWQPLIQSSSLTVRLCFENIKSVGQNEGWKIALLNENNYKNYIQNMTHFTLVKNQSQHYEKKDHFKKLLALTILKHHGGLWIDINSLMIHGLKWLQNISNLSYLITNLKTNNQGSQPDLILPYISYYQSHSQKRESDGSIVNYLPGYRNWFIFAREQSPIINLWLKNYEKHYITSTKLNKFKQVQKNYFFHHLEDEEFQVEKALCEIIQQKQIQLDKSTSIFDQRKNANTEFKIIGFHAEYGPMIFDLNILDHLNMGMTHSLKEIQKQYLININFFVRLNPKNQQYFQQKLNALVQVGNKHPNIYNNFTGFLQNQSAVQYCESLTFIVEESIIGELIKNNSIAIKNNLHSITIKQREQWQQYCNQKVKNFNINQIHQYDLSSSDEDANVGKKCFYQILNWAVHWNLISGASRSVIREYFEIINWRSSYSDVREVYFWKMLNGIKKQIQFGLLQQVSQEKYNSLYYRNQQNSWIQLKILHFKLKILNSRPIIAHFYQILFSIITHLWKLIPIMSLGTAIINLIFIMIKNHKKMIKWLVKLSWGLLKQGEVDMSIRWEILQTYKSLFKGSVKQRWKVMRRALICVKGFFVGITLRVMVILFYCQVIVAYEEICFNGHTDFQQPWLILIVFTKIILQKFVSSFTHPDPWGIFGFDLIQLFNAMLPIYCFCLGSCIIEFAWLREDQIFVVALQLCAIVPMMYKELEIIARKLLPENQANHIKSSKKHQIIKRILKIFSQITKYVERSVLIFLFSLILVPNLRHFYLSNENNDHFLKKLFSFILHSSKHLIWLLCFMYIYEILQMLKQLSHEWINNKIMGREKKGEEYTEEMIMMERVLDEMYADEENKEEEVLYEELEKIWVDLYQIRNSSIRRRNNAHNLINSNTNQSVSSRIIISPMFFQHFFVLLLTLLQHSINFYMFFLLLVNPLPDLIDTQYMKIWRVKTIPIVLVVGMSFQIQRQISKMLDNNSQRCRKFNNGVVRTTHENVNQSREQCSDQTVRRRKKLNHFEKYSIVISSISLIVFEWVRMTVVSSLVKYCEDLSSNRFEQQLEFERTIDKLALSSMIYTLFGYVVIRALVKYYVRGEEVNFLKRAYHYLLYQQEYKVNSKSICQYFSYYCGKLSNLLKKGISQKRDEVFCQRGQRIVIRGAQLQEQQLLNQ